MTTAQGRMGGVVLGLILVMVTGCAAGTFTKDETPGQRFDRAMEEFAEKCAKAKLKPNDTACDILKLKPADPLATDEGRFAHSIKIPNPVSADSGYKPGMTPQEYFDHLCKTEAGEFIYKTVENVEGLYMMRPREEVSDDKLQHLHVLEDPYGATDDPDSQDYLVQPPFGRYQFMESLRTKDEVGTAQPYVRYFRGSERESKKDYVYMDGTRSHRVPYVVKREGISSLKSRYGYTWRGIQRPHDRELGIVGGELIVLDMRSNEVLAARRGFIRSGDVRNNLTGVWWLGGHVCPVKKALTSSQFIQKVIRPISQER
ncbi:MAG: hypothetical protein CAF45_000790 [Nitrospira sp. CG24E]|nr:MAG: hypothetical protein CAF45_000790 [Nitrospira sp. CG24E]